MVYPTFWDRPTATVPWLELYLEAEKSTVTYAERPVDYSAEEICDFVARVAQSQGPSVTAEDGLWVDRIINACYRSSDEGRRVGL